MSNQLHTPELRATVAQKYLDGVASAHVLASEYDISKFTVRVWAQKYKEHGISAFIRGCGNSRYTSDFKQMCVELYLKGEMSVDEIVAKYNISARSVLQR